MAKYQGIATSIFDEPEYKDPTELLIAMYIMINRDMAGVCPIKENVVAAKCRTSVAKLRKTLKRFAEIGKVKLSSTGSHVWFKSGINHSLYKGNFSSNQLQSVVHLMSKWDQSKLFGDGFALEVVQLYASKYNIVIPYPKTGDTHAYQSQSYTETEYQSESESRGSDYFSKFNRTLKPEDEAILLKHYKDPELLKFMVKNIRITENTTNPVGFLIAARGAPGSYLSDRAYDKWKLLLREVASRDR